MRLGSGKGAVALRSSARDQVSRGFTLVEDVVYVGLGLLLSRAVVVLLVSLAINFWLGLVGGALPGSVIVVRDQILLILMIVVLLYTVQLSFREHVLIPEPFVLVALHCQRPPHPRACPRAAQGGGEGRRAIPRTPWSSWACSP